MPPEPSEPKIQLSDIEITTVNTHIIYAYKLEVAIWISTTGLGMCKNGYSCTCHKHFFVQIYIEQLTCVAQCAKIS